LNEKSLVFYAWVLLRKSRQRFRVLTSASFRMDSMAFLIQPCRLKDFEKILDALLTDMYLAEFMGKFLMDAFSRDCGVLKT